MSIYRLNEHQLLPEEPNTDLVEALEGLLERAKRGEVRALAWAGLTGNDHIVTGWDGPSGTYFSMSAGISCLQHRYCEFMMEPDE